MCTFIPSPSDCECFPCSHSGKWVFCNEVSEKIRDILLDKNLSISDESETMLFLAARGELFLKNIQPKTSVFSELIEGNFCTINLYRKEGFKEIVFRNNYYGVGKNAVIMENIKYLVCLGSTVKIKK